jgi:hypothetical protein
MLEKFTGIGLIVGTLLFLIAAFMPITYQVITSSDPQQFIRLIENNRMSWVMVNILFGVGSIITVVGILLFALHTRSISTSGEIRWASLFGSGAAAIGATLWVIIVYNRAALPPEALVGNLAINSWMFPAYTLLTQFALMVIGFMLLKSNYPGWMSWGMMGVAALSVVTYLVFKDMPPFAHYVPLLVMGVALIR